MPCLREQLAEREIEPADEDWLRRMVEGVRNHRNYMIDSEPSDFVATRALRRAGAQRQRSAPGVSGAPVTLVA